MQTQCPHLRGLSRMPTAATFGAILAAVSAHRRSRQRLPRSGPGTVSIEVVSCGRWPTGTERTAGRWAWEGRTDSLFFHASLITSKFDYLRAPVANWTKSRQAGVDYWKFDISMNHDHLSPRVGLKSSGKIPRLLVCGGFLKAGGVCRVRAGFRVWPDACPRASAGPSRSPRSPKGPPGGSAVAGYGRRTKKSLTKVFVINLASPVSEKLAATRCKSVPIPFSRLTPCARQSCKAYLSR